MYIKEARFTDLGLRFIGVADEGHRLEVVLNDLGRMRVPEAIINTSSIGVLQRGAGGDLEGVKVNLLSPAESIGLVINRILRGSAYVTGRPEHYAGKVTRSVAEIYEVADDSPL